MWQLFERVRTQWRVGMRGPIGLDYSALYPLIDRMRLGHDEWLQVLDDIQAMELAAMDQLQQQAGEA